MPKSFDDADGRDFAAGLYDAPLADLATLQDAGYAVCTHAPSVAYDAGAQARQANAPVDECPYPLASAEALQWLAGWKDAQ